MKTKNILMSILLVMGSIAAKAAGYPPELALVSQPVMVYNYNSITVYYDVENIGDYTYRGDVCIFLDPDDGYCYAEEYVKVRPGRIKRIAVEIPSYRIDRHFTYTIMPYYSIGNELYSFTTFEYFEPIRFCWHGPRTEPWVAITVGPRVRYYHRPGTFRYYYDGFRPPMPPPATALECRPRWTRCTTPTATITTTAVILPTTTSGVSPSRTTTSPHPVQPSDRKPMEAA